MLKLNVNGQSFVVDGYTRSPIAQINFHSPLTIAMGVQSPLRFLSNLLNSKQTQKLAIHLDINVDCKYECEMTSFEPVYETIHTSEDVRVAKFYDFLIGFGNHALGCEHIDIELHPVRTGFYAGALKSKVWFLSDDQDINSLTPPWSLNLRYHDPLLKQWVPLLDGWELQVTDNVNSQPVSLFGKTRGVQIVTPLAAILI